MRPCQLYYDNKVVKKTTVKVAITGGVACGKSTAGKILEDMGFPIEDSDRIARELFDHDESCRKEILHTLGSLDRNQIRDLVFSNPQKKKILEEILHPRIRAEYLQWMHRQLEKNPRYIFVMIPLLFESSGQKYFDKVLCIDCDTQTQLTRLTQRPGIDDVLAKKIIQSQLPKEEKARLSDWVVDASHGIPEMKQSLEKIFGN